MKKLAGLVVLFTLVISSLGCAGARVKPGERLRILYTGDTWGALFPQG